MEKNVRIEKIRNALKEIIDPELHINIVDLGLIYDIDLTPLTQMSKDEQNLFDAEITMTLTSPGCPLSYVFEELIPAAVKKVEGIYDVNIHLVWEPPWDPEKISDDIKEEMGIIR